MNEAKRIHKETIMSAISEFMKKKKGKKSDRER